MMVFNFTPLLRPELPVPAPRWSGFPKFNFVGGHNDSETFPLQAFIHCMEQVLQREGKTLSTYGLESGPQGYRPLREFLSQSLFQKTGMKQSAEDILIVSGSLQALDLVNEILLEKGDTVIVEEATYQGALQRLDRAGVRYIGAPLDNLGIRMEALENILKRLHKKEITPKYIYTIPTVQNPTGTIMPEGRRLEMLKIAREYAVPIFEDDCYADLTFGAKRPKAIRALDEGGQVIFCGSFSKTVAPALRVGFLAAEWKILSQIIAVKDDAGSGALEQMVLGEYCSNNFDDHLERLRAVLKNKCETIKEALAAEFGAAAEFSGPSGGIFIWVTLPKGVDTTKLSEVAALEGIAINPGHEWSADPESGRQKLRLCFGHPSVGEIREGISRLADICHRETGIPERGRNLRR